MKNIKKKNNKLKKTNKTKKINKYNKKTKKSTNQNGGEEEHMSNLDADIVKRQKEREKKKILLQTLIRLILKNKNKQIISNKY